jgi:acyl dehydratase
MTGRSFDDWRVGDKIAHALRLPVTEASNASMCHLTHNTQPLHLDHEYAAKTEFGQIVVNGLYTFSTMIGVSVEDTTQGTLIANLGYDKVLMPMPVFIGDTLRFETEVIGLRPSKSRPGAGIVTFKHWAFNQRDVLVCEATRIALVRRT